MSNEKLIKKVFEENDGIFRMNPNYIPRNFLKAGKRLKLHPDDYYAFGMERGPIVERWFGSVVAADNGPLTSENEGLSSIAVGFDTDEKFFLSEALDLLGEELIGKRLMDDYGTWPTFTKFYDFSSELFFHVHFDDEYAEKLGIPAKPESYYFPPQLNAYKGDSPMTYFGFKPGVTKEDVKARLEKFNDADMRMKELSQAYVMELGTGWYVPGGVIHGPASLVTYEPQWNADNNAIFDNVVGGNEVYLKDALVKQLPDEDKDDLDQVMTLLNWEENVRPDFVKTYFRPPVIAHETEEYVEKWISYANKYFSAKELTIKPGKTVVIKDAGCYDVIFVQGRGKFGCHDAETPTMLRVGQQTADEYFVSEPTAKKGVTITNTSMTEDMVMLKHFGPMNPEMPF